MSSTFCVFESMFEKIFLSLNLLFYDRVRVRVIVKNSNIKRWIYSVTFWYEIGNDDGGGVIATWLVWNENNEGRYSPGIASEVPVNVSSYFVIDSLFSWGDTNPNPNPPRRWFLLLSIVRDNLFFFSVLWFSFPFLFSLAAAIFSNFSFSLPIMYSEKWA